MPTDHKNDLHRTATIVAAYASTHALPASQLPALIANVHAALTKLDLAAMPATRTSEKLSPAAIRHSIKPDALISFLDGKAYRMLRRHLRSHGLTPETYRERFGLPTNYPMTATSYSEVRSVLAKRSGLGRKAA